MVGVFAGASLLLAPPDLSALLKRHQQFGTPFGCRLLDRFLDLRQPTHINLDLWIFTRSVSRNKLQLLKQEETSILLTRIRFIHALFLNEMPKLNS
jgi:hypothetical protein